jgi:cytochrome c5
MKSFPLLLTLCVALSLTACGKDEPAATAKPAATAAVEQAKQVAQQATETVAQVATQAEEKASAVVEQIKEALVSGEAIYNQSCISCHKTGLMGAPKLGDKEAWSGLIAAGQEKLVNNSIKGIGKMPAKGGASSLSDKEVAAAVEYMIEQSR